MQAILDSRLRANLSLLVIGALLLASLMGAAIAQNSLLGALLCVPLAGIAMIVQPWIGLYAILVGAYSLDWLSRALGLLPTQARWLPDLILVTLALVVIAKAVLERKGLRRTPLDGPFLVLIIFGIMSALVNGSSPATALNGYRTLLKPLMLFYVIINLDVSPRTLKHLIILLIGLELLQIPITVLQAQVYGVGDEVGGTLGYSATQIATIMALMVMSLLFGLATVSRKGWVYILGGIGLFVPILMGEGKFGYFVVLPMVLFIFAYRAPNRIRSVFVVLALLLIVLFVSLQALPVIAPRSQLGDFLASPRLIFEIYERPLAQTGVPMSRRGDIQFAIELLGRTPHALLLGYGPGAASPSYFGDIVGQLYNDNGYLGSVFGLTQISRGLLEWGITGVLLYLVMILRVYRISQQLLNRSDVEPFWKGISLGFRGVLVVFLVSTAYWYVWQSDATAFVFWMLAGATYSISTVAPKETDHVK